MQYMFRQRFFSLYQIEQPDTLFRVDYRHLLFDRTDLFNIYYNNIPLPPVNVNDWNKAAVLD